MHLFQAFLPVSLSGWMILASTWGPTRTSYWFYLKEFSARPSYWKVFIDLHNWISFNRQLFWKHFFWNLYKIWSQFIERSEDSPGSQIRGHNFEVRFKNSSILLWHHFIFFMCTNEAEMSSHKLPQFNWTVRRGL